MSAWNTAPTGFDPFGQNPHGDDDRYETIELVGPHLRVSGKISLLKFARLTDRINHSAGYVRLTDARLLRRNGEPTNLVVPELMVNQDEITFIGQTEDEVSTVPTSEVGGMDRPLMTRISRQIVIFTPGHTLTGTVFLFSDTDISTFVDSPDPRFVPMTKVTARSLADRRVISHFGLILINRTQMTAASLVEKAGSAIETGIVVD
jgi:hypothetical protein